jgi:hypothetical protein
VEIGKASRLSKQYSVRGREPKVAKTHRVEAQTISTCRRQAPVIRNPRPNPTAFALLQSFYVPQNGQPACRETGRNPHETGPSEATISIESRRLIGLQFNAGHTTQRRRRQGSLVSACMRGQNRCGLYRHVACETRHHCDDRGNKLSSGQRLKNMIARLVQGLLTDYYGPGRLLYLLGCRDRSSSIDAADLRRDRRDQVDPMIQVGSPRNWRPSPATIRNAGASARIEGGARGTDGRIGIWGHWFGTWHMRCCIVR